MKQKVLLVIVLVIIVLIWYLQQISYYDDSDQVQTIIDNQPLIWFTLINYGYIDFTKNFLESMRRNNIKFKLLVYCLDDETVQALKEYSDTCVCIRYDKGTSKELVTWQTPEFKKICFMRLDIIRDLMQKYKCNVGHIDTDIVLLKDPTPIVLNAMKNNPEIDLVAQCDENGVQCTKHTKCPAFCNGVMLLKYTPKILKCFEYTEDEVNNSKNGDQDFLLGKFNKYGIKTLTIDKNIFLNGSYEGIQSGSPATLPKEACLVHFNWMVGKDKMVRMKEQNMWYT